MHDILNRPVPSWIKPVLLAIAVVIAAAPAAYMGYGYLKTAGYFEPAVTDCCAPEA